MKFPFIDDALSEVLADLGTVVYHLPKNPVDRVPLIHLSAIPSPGASEPWQLTERYLIEVYDIGRTATRALAHRVVDRLDGKTLATQAGLIDRVDVVITPNERPLEDDSLNSFNLSVVAQARPIPEN